MKGRRTTRCTGPQPRLVQSRCLLSRKHNLSPKMVVCYHVFCSGTAQAAPSLIAAAAGELGRWVSLYTVRESRSMTEPNTRQSRSATAKETACLQG